MIVRALLAAGLAAIATRAAAVETPRAGDLDPRIKSVEYEPRQVVRIVGAFRTATQVRFAADETILHVAVGDTSGWDVVPETNSLFVKPKEPRAPTNLIVTTRTGAGEQHHYTFELVTRSGVTTRATPETYFVVQFRYPEAEKASVVAALSAQAQLLEQRVVQLKLDRGVLEGERNLAYELQGGSAIAPSEVTDNGRFTVLRFPGAQALPAVFAVAPDGAETLVPFDVRGEFLVVHQVAAQLRLRKGREVVCIFNLAYAPAGRTTGTSTAAPDVDRTLRPEVRP